MPLGDGARELTNEEIQLVSGGIKINWGSIVKTVSGIATNGAVNRLAGAGVIAAGSAFVADGGLAGTLLLLGIAL